MNLNFRFLLLFPFAATLFLALVSGCASDRIKVSVDTEPYRQQMIDICIETEPENNYCNLSVDRFLYLARKDGLRWRMVKNHYYSCKEKYEDPEKRRSCYEPHYRESWERLVENYSLTSELTRKLREKRSDN